MYKKLSSVQKELLLFIILLVRKCDRVASSDLNPVIIESVYLIIMSYAIQF